MKDKYFRDTHIFIYSFDPNEQTKRAIARDLIQDALLEQSGCLSSLSNTPVAVCYEISGLD
jgi:predicted nucleic acid-binding protein